MTDSERMRIRRVKNKENGICTCCTKCPAELGKTRCKECNLKHSIDTAKRNKSLPKEICKACHSKLVIENRSVCALCREKQNEAYRKIKKIVFDYYGNKCTCCGETNIGFLTIDHVNSDGFMDRQLNGHRKSTDTIYRFIIKNNFPDTFQILCYNCNLGRAKYKGICPHKLLEEGI